MVYFSYCIVCGIRKLVFGLKKLSAAPLAHDLLTDLDFQLVQQRSSTIQRLQSQVKDILSTATVVEETIEEIRLFKVSIDNLAHDVCFSGRVGQILLS